ncbi:hypothetical protein QLQ12_08950 [Actinoplanes sp. NEAU-A12]|uniref:Uncharacterized protein n=1 Tax=Actinoplanes sandaracinus TaxID=3045177 RepID=A0ABT6WG70_9ACTN|nr:hypothetical protein [Actinoplanes sandaracinus]MDI6098726.1 hypothetical protein [Actinoplanes sandaracinus]
MGRHAEFTAATSTPVYFCDPTSPWQRGSNDTPAQRFTRLLAEAA